VKSSCRDRVDFSQQVHRERRLRLAVRGLVQGVGFRPFVYRLATKLGLSGWVRNSPQAVQIELEGCVDKLNEFIQRLGREKPRCAFIQSQQVSFLDPIGYSGFSVRESDQSGEKTALILPDIATCPDCLKEIFDPSDRRYRYPFTNCTNCGPRFSIIESLPYDRVSTTMKVFPMCEECRREYEDPLNRRFHTQPNACPDCGPHLELWDAKGEILASHDDALLEACNSIKRGKILALKGLGGFQLLVDARNDDAVTLLRQRKAREEKPLALMYPNLHAVKNECQVSNLEEKLLDSYESPIVLLRRRIDKNSYRSGICPSVAPGNPYFGIMLPYTPLHHLLMTELDFPIVATSGNLSDEPICIDEHEAQSRLGKIADLFLVHNRPIVRQVDDSVVRLMMGRQLVLRAARGYAPTAIQLKEPVPPSLAVGAHLKNSVAIGRGKYAFVSQHIGDLESKQAYEALGRVVQSLSNIYDFQPAKVVSDLHPDYLSTKFAFGLALPLNKIQHHYAHVLSCMADNELEGPALGVSWDGTGLGLDGTIWGGEFLRVDKESFTRVAHLRTFRLPGSEKAVYEPRRSAVGLLYEIFGERLFSMDALEPLKAFDTGEKEILHNMLERKINAPVTSSAGRLFDAVVSIIGLCQTVSYEGQAPMKLEFAAGGLISEESYRFNIDQQTQSFVVDWEPMIRDILNDVQRATSTSQIAAKFHNTLVDMIVQVAKIIGEQKVVLTGGCFQNKYLTERTVCCLKSAGFKPFWHQRIPPNDGGIALGQIVATSRHKPQGE